VLWLKTLETVAILTPAFFAISYIVEANEYNLFKYAGTDQGTCEKRLINIFYLIRVILLLLTKLPASSLYKYTPEESELALNETECDPEVIVLPFISVATF